ncbi:MAG: MBL fold metallo-hydrolase [Bacteroidales bacterium]|nr:MBL fold metallo-hydrolase [Bacteroidales bacterium]
MIRFKSFSSGSCGNCSFLGTTEGGRLHGVLIDAGISWRTVLRALSSDGLSPANIGAILVTHDHYDHIRHLGSFCKRMSVPVYSTETILAAVRKHPYTGLFYGKGLDPLEWTPIAEGIEIQCFTVPHDAAETVGYAIRLEGRIFVIMTDIGEMTNDALELARQADTVVIESNYDKDMLLGGGYTFALKMRISKGFGHLSNAACADALRDIWHPGLRNIFLCHLSANNNTPELALESARAALSSVGAPLSGTSASEPAIALRVLPRGVPTQLFVL